MTVVHSVYREPAEITIDHSSCSRCGQCAATCPVEVLRLEGGRVIVSTDSLFGCIACGHCMMVCPEKSIKVSGRGLSPADIVMLAAATQTATSEQLGALMQKRRSIRYFEQREVERSTLKKIADMAASAPMGIPPWDIGLVTVCGRAQVRQLAGEIIGGYRDFLRSMPSWLLKALRPVLRKATYEQLNSFVRPLAETYVDHWHRGRDVLFYDAPAVMIFHHSPYADSADAMIACTYAMLAAESLGLGNTMIGGAAPVLKRNKALCRRIGIPAGNTPAIALILGYAANSFKRSVSRHFTSVQFVDGPF